MENIHVHESPGPHTLWSPPAIIVQLNKAQATALQQAIEKWLSVKAVMGTFDSGADLILQDFANEIEVIANRM